MVLALWSEFMTNIRLIHRIMGKSLTKLPLFPLSLSLHWLLLSFLFSFPRPLLLFHFSFWFFLWLHFHSCFSQLNQYQQYNTKLVVYCFKWHSLHPYRVYGTCHVAFVAYSSEKLLGWWSHLYNSIQNTQHQQQSHNRRKEKSHELDELSKFFLVEMYDLRSFFYSVGFYCLCNR